MASSSADDVHGGGELNMLKLEESLSNSNFGFSDSVDRLGEQSPMAQSSPLTRSFSMSTDGREALNNYGVVLGLLEEQKREKDCQIVELRREKEELKKDLRDKQTEMNVRIERLQSEKQNCERELQIEKEKGAERQAKIIELECEIQKLRFQPNVIGNARRGGEQFLSPSCNGTFRGNEHDESENYIIIRRGEEPINESTNIRDCQCIDLSSEDAKLQSVSQSQMQKPRAEHFALTIDNQIYVFGGDEDSSIGCLDEVKGGWNLSGKLLEKRVNCGKRFSNLASNNKSVCWKKQQRFELVNVKPIVSYPRDWPLSTDLLFDVIMFFNIATLFRLTATNRRFANFFAKNPALALLYEKGTRHVENLRIGSAGFGVNNEKMLAEQYYSANWIKAPTPIYPIPFDQIIGFRNIFISANSFPADEHQISNAQTTKICPIITRKDVSMFFDALFSVSLSAEYSIHMQGYISATSLSFLIEFLHQVGDNCFKQFRIESSYLTDLPNEFWETPAFLGTCCLHIKYYNREDNRLLNNLCQWLLYSPAFDEMKLKTNARVEKTLIIETKCSKNLLLFLINEFSSAQSAAPFVVAVKLMRHPGPITELRLKNDSTGELLTWGPIIDDHGGRGIGTDETIFIRRRPQIGPLLPVDLSIFDEADQPTIRIH